MTLRRRWDLAWLGASVLGVANGIARDKLYAGRLGEQRAHLVSTATLLAALLAYTHGVQSLWPLRSRADALAVGANWLGLTMAFEFGFGHFVAHTSWDELLADYDLRRGRLWALIPAWMALGPLLVSRRAEC